MLILYNTNRVFQPCVRISRIQNATLQKFILSSKLIHIARNVEFRIPKRYARFHY